MNDKCSYRVHLNNPTSYRQNGYDKFNKTQLQLTSGLKKFRFYVPSFCFRYFTNKSR